MEQTKKLPLVITIGRQYGSGGRDIGKMISEKLGIGFYDQKLVELAAETAGLNQDIAAKNEENVSGKFFFPKKNASAPYAEKVFAAQSQVINQIAARESCVIIGRCADFVLKGRENLLRVFVYADNDSRAKRCIEVYGVQEAAARMDMRKTDAQRESYYNSFADNPWGSYSNYDLMLNSGLLGIEGCVEMILLAAEKL